MLEFKQLYLNNATDLASVSLTPFLNEKAVELPICSRAKAIKSSSSLANSLLHSL